MDHNKPQSPRSLPTQDALVLLASQSRYSSKSEEEAVETALTMWGVAERALERARDTQARNAELSKPPITLNEFLKTIVDPDLSVAMPRWRNFLKFQSKSKPLFSIPLSEWTADLLKNIPGATDEEIAVTIAQQKKTPFYPAAVEFLKSNYETWWKCERSAKAAKSRAVRTGKQPEGSVASVQNGQRKKK